MSVLSEVSLVVRVLFLSLFFLSCLVSLFSPYSPLSFSCHLFLCLISPSPSSSSFFVYLSSSLHLSKILSFFLSPSLPLSFSLSSLFLRLYPQNCWVVRSELCCPSAYEAAARNLLLLWIHLYGRCVLFVAIFRSLLQCYFFLSSHPLPSRFVFYCTIALFLNFVVL